MEDIVLYLCICMLNVVFGLLHSSQEGFKHICVFSAHVFINNNVSEKYNLQNNIVYKYYICARLWKIASIIDHWALDA